ncbi:MAG: DNA-binding transcriptional regulator [Planctomycetales bacterium]|nr:DNA-binding transcriptional regulator [Planctomycetales bacterium]
MERWIAREKNMMASNGIPQVALIIETSMAYGRGLLRGVSQYMTEHNYWSTYIDQRSLNDPPPAWLAGWKGNGVIVRAQTRRMANVVAKLKCPAIDTLHHYDNLDIPLVIPDHYAIAETAAQHFLERHFRHFAFVGVERAHWSKERRDALVDVLRKAGFPCHVYSPLSRRRFNESWEGGQKDLTEWLLELPKPLGVMTAHDLRALCVLDACRRGGLNVPEQVAVIGVDNDEPLCMHGNPPLSSVVVDHNLIGYRAAELLDRMMKKKKRFTRPIKIKPQGVITRRSTEVVAIEDMLTAKAVRYIRENACEGIDVNDVAKHCGVSRRTMERSFANFLDMSPHDQIIRTKIARAKELLVESEYPLDTIAVKCGLSQAAYLNVLFKREVGVTPGQFRQTVANGV